MEQQLVLGSDAARRTGESSRLDPVAVLVGSLREILPEVRVAVELGPGTRPLMPALQGRFCRIAVDLELSDEARIAFHECHVGRAEALPLASASADLIVSKWVLEHVQDSRRAIAEAARVLRPGGVFAFVTPNVRHPIYRANYLLQRALPFGVAQRVVSRLTGRSPADIYPAYYRLSTARRLERLWRPYGTAIVHRIDATTYGIDLGFATRGPLADWKPLLVGRLERSKERLDPVEVG